MSLEKYFNDENHQAYISLIKAEASLDIIENLINCMGLETNKLYSANKHIENIMSIMSIAKHFLQDCRTN